MTSAAPYELSASNAADYLLGRGVRAERVTELGGGVSNTVLLVEADGRSFVLKQSLPRLRVRDEWLADRSRIRREAESIADAARFLPADSVPALLWADEANFAFAMEAAAGNSWKDELMGGRVDVQVAARVGALLGTFVRATWGREDFREKYADQHAFDQLRIDPYYRTVACRHADLAGAIQNLIEESAARRVALVHGDWSPKNIIVGTNNSVTLIDFEVVHYGDPCFDAAFCLNHLLLKWFHLPDRRGELERAAEFFWREMVDNLPGPALEFFEPGTLRHLGALMLARADGKSPAEYLDDATRARVRAAARDLVTSPPQTLADVARRVRRQN